MARRKRVFRIAINVTMRHVYEIAVPPRTRIEPWQWANLLDKANPVEAEGVETKIQYIEEVLSDGKTESVSRHDPVLPRSRKKNGRS